MRLGTLSDYRIWVSGSDLVRSVCLCRLVPVLDLYLYLYSFFKIIQKVLGLGKNFRAYPSLYVATPLCATQLTAKSRGERE